MKKIITLAIFLLSMSTLALPKHLKGAHVTVTLKNGKKYTYTSEEMAVVKRETTGQLATAHKTIKRVYRALKHKKIVSNKRNRIYILGGIGNSGKLKTKTDGSSYKTEIKQGGVFGVGIQRKINDGDYNVGVQVQNNGTTSLTFGTDF